MKLIQPLEFYKRILDIFDTLNTPMYAIHTDHDVLCPCRKTINTGGDPHCKLCFGIGYKIWIQEINGIFQPGEESRVHLADMANKSITDDFYFKGEDLDNLKGGDYIVCLDDNSAHIIQYANKWQIPNNAYSGTVDYVYYASAMPIKNNPALFMQLFWEAVGE